MERSPGKETRQKEARKSAGPSPKQPAGDPRHWPPGGEGTTDQDSFWAKMGGMLGGMETRLMSETTAVREQLGQAIGDLGSRVERTEKRLDEFTDEVNRIGDMRLEKLNTLSYLAPGGGDGDGGAIGGSKPDGSCSPGFYAAAAASSPAGQATAGLRMMQPKKSARSREEDYWHSRRSLRIRPVSPGDDRQGF